ncbi:helix-turn-helix domain-containing protein [Derxia lacustris]|uniref:helix-turn-helix domain-containing protein n=1 Tax=Derxia lacustris TaxID=764842 RepID=UPI000A16DC63|nr:helix-turn-helix domain-containing protein [Derxia lacustris]
MPFDDSALSDCLVRHGEYQEPNSSCDFVGWQLEYDQLAAGRFLSRARELHVDGIQIFTESTNALLGERGCGPAGDFIFGFPLGFAEGDDCLLNGQRWGRGAAPLFRGGVEIEAVLPPMDLLVVSVRQELLADYAEVMSGIATRHWLAGSQIAVFDNAPLVRAAGNGIAALAQTLFDAPGRLAGAPARRQVQQEVLGALLPIVEQSLGLPELASSDMNRTRVVQRARDYALGHLDEPLQIIDVCRALGVSRRTLQYSFEQVLGMNPLSYLRTLRLNGARRDLLAAAEREVKVKDVVERWGFWHLSRFSAEYRELFHELPSETLATARDLRVLAQAA